MGGIGFLPGGGSQPPTDIPYVRQGEVKAREIAEQVAKGLDESGWWVKIIRFLFRELTAWWEIVLENLLALGTRIGVWIAERLINAENRSQPAFDRLAAAAIEDVLGVRVQIGGMSDSGGRGHRTRVAKDIGSAIIQSITSQAELGPGGRIKPSTAAVESFVSAMVSMAMEGWLEGWITEALSAGAIETFGDLDDKLKESLGLSLLSSAMMSPLVNIVARDPFEWHLNRTYRPRLMNARLCVRQYTRGAWTRERVEEELALQGYSPDRIEALLYDEARYFSVSDLDTLVSTGKWTRAQAVEHLKAQGYTEAHAATLLDLQEAGRLNSYRKQYANIAADAYVAGKIDLGAWNKALDTAQLPEREKQMLRITTGLRRELRIKSLSMSDVEQAVRRNILTINDYRRYLRDEGYSDADARTLELMLLFDIRTTEEAEQRRRELEAQREAERQAKLEADRKRRAEIEAELAVREVSLSEMQRLVKRGLRSLDDYSALLAANKYAAADVEALTDLLHQEIVEAEEAAAERERLKREAAVRQVAIGDFEQSVKRGIVSMEDYRAYLAGQGFAPQASDLLLTLLAAEMDDDRRAQEEKEAAAAQLREREVSLADVEQGVRRGFVSIEQYREFLAAQGFGADRRDLLVQLVEADIAQDNEARRRREAAEERAAQREVSLGDWEQLVRAGIRTMSQYRAELARLGFTAADQDALERLLKLDIDAETAAAAKREEAAARAAARQVSLADVERAVKLGVVTMDSYRTTLTRLGFSAADQQLLAGTLLAELAATRQAQQERERAAALARQRGLSLGQFEAAVRSGLRSLAEYEAFLVGLGYSAGDARTLGQLLGTEIEQRQAAEAKRREAENTLRARNLTLGTWEAAVKGGIRGMEEYVAFLEGQGFVADDVATLVALLVSEIEAEAAAAG